MRKDQPPSDEGIEALVHALARKPPSPTWPAPSVRYALREGFPDRIKCLILLAWIVAATLVMSSFIALVEGMPGIISGTAMDDTAVCIVGPLTLMVMHVRLLRRGRLIAWRHALEPCFRQGRLMRCLACDYDLRGSVAATCPECGAPIELGFQ